MSARISGTVNFREAPMGVDVNKFIFSWKFQGFGNGAAQMAYRIRVKKVDISGEEIPVWDSGKTESQVSAAIPYTGKRLEEQTVYKWKVQVWMRQEPETLESDWQCFETNISPKSWKGEWIGGGVDFQDPLPVFRKTFRISRPVKRARIYMTALGHYELWLNGHRQGKSVLEPAWTDPNKSISYEIYDVTESLKEGRNVIGVYLGNGLQRIDGSRYAKYTVDRGEPGILMHMEMWYQDGSRQQIGSDTSFLVKDGPITYSSFYGGEDWDARKDPGNFEDWKEEETRSAVRLVPPKGVLVRRVSPAIRVQEILSPVRWEAVGEHRYIYDFGKNISGMVRIKVRGCRGQKIRLTPGELLKEDGRVNQQFTGGPHYYEYTLCGRPEEECCSKFTYYGFRYVEIEGVRHPEESGDVPVILEAKGRMISAAVEQTGKFFCDYPLWNQIHEMILQAMKCNAQSVLTDCPHREKLGWMEQTHLIGPSLLYNFSMYSLYEKILQDIREAQSPDGMIPSIAPEFTEFSQGFRDSVEWGSAGILVPWYLYRIFQNPDLLRRQFTSMNRYMEYLENKTQCGVIHDGLGDWCDFGVNPPFAQNTPVSLTATAMYYYDLMVMEQVSGLLNDQEKQQLYKKRIARTRQAFNREFYESMGKRYSTGSQTANSMALFLDLMKQTDQPGVLASLLKDLHCRGYHMTGGDVGFPFLLRALTKYGYGKIIARMMTNTDIPSYGYQVIHGATTLCEEWDGNCPGKEKNSQNHFMLGSIEEWFYGGLGGIQLFHGPLSQELRICPTFASQVNLVETQCEIAGGTVKSCWKRESTGRIQLAIQIPANTCAVILLPQTGNEEMAEKWKRQEGVVRIDCTDRYYEIHTESGTYSFDISEQREEMEDETVV